MERCCDIEEGVNPDPTEPRTVYSSLAHRIKKKIDILPPLFPDESCIYRVHQRLRSVNSEAYTPIVISIGPYHRGKKELCAMEEHKLRSLQSFLERREENDMEMYLLNLAEQEDRARKFYADPIDLNAVEFVEMMLLDGCFIIEFLRKSLEDFECVDYVILRDMILLENQLPYFVLTQLYAMNTDSNGESLMVMAKLCVTFLLSNETCHFDGSNDTPEIKHLLHLVQVFFSPSSEQTSIVRDTRSSGLRWPCCPLSKLKNITRNIKSSVLFCPLFKPTSNHNVHQIRSAMELHDAGVKFKKVDKGMFDIKFDNGLMEVPFFNVHDLTETLFRNLVAYEQHSMDDKPKYFTDYISFMDQLISSEKDVNLLRLKGIIDNWLGDDQEVCKLFNRLGDGVVSSTSYYSPVCKRVKEHCKIPWNQKKAKLRHNYFSSPWAGISTLAAAVLLLLTLLQTIAAFTK